MLFDDGYGAGVEVAGTGVVAEAGPFDEDGVERGGREVGSGANDDAPTPGNDDLIAEGF